MPEQVKKVNALSAQVAYQLANVTKTPAQFQSITPRWLTRLLEWKPLDAGAFRLNKVKEGETPVALQIKCATVCTLFLHQGTHSICKTSLIA